MYLLGSTLRDIPDNQEVFVHSTTDQSIIVEILQYLDEGDEQAVRYLQQLTVIVVWILWLFVEKVKKFEFDIR